MISKDDKKTQAHLHLGLIFFNDDKRQPEAEKALRTAVLQKNTITIAYFRLGVLYHKQKKLAEAARDLATDHGTFPRGPFYHGEW